MFPGNQASSNTPSTSPQEHYKRVVAIPLIDCFINQLEDSFHGDGSHASMLLCLIPSVMLSSKVQFPDHLDDFLYWKEDLPCSTSLGSELRQWQSLWQQESQNVVDVFIGFRFMLYRFFSKHSVSL